MRLPCVKHTPSRGEMPLVPLVYTSVATSVTEGAVNGGASGVTSARPISTTSSYDSTGQSTWSARQLPCPEEIVGRSRYMYDVPYSALSP